MCIVAENRRDARGVPAGVLDATLWKQTSNASVQATESESWWTKPISNLDHVLDIQLSTSMRSHICKLKFKTKTDDWLFLWLDVTIATT